MIYQTTHVFDGSTPISIITLLGTDQVENFTARKIAGEGSFYIGNENVSPVSYGLQQNHFDGIYFPKISLVTNPNLYLCGDAGVSISILAWQ